MTIPLSQLVTPSTQPQALTNILNIASALGLSTTAWQPVGMARTILATMATVVSSYSSTVALIAQGGFLSYAAQMVDNLGNPITTWMDLLSVNVFNVTRITITAAAGPVPVSNSSGLPQPYVAGQLHFSNLATGATYTNTTAGTIAGSGASTIQVQADAAFAGTVGTTGAGVTLTMTTPFPGVTVSPLVASLVGANAETNAALLIRCQAKLASLSPNGAPGAYYFEATSIPQGTQNPTPPYLPYAVSAVLTRVQVIFNTQNGIVSVYLANAAGIPTALDVTIVNAAIQALVTPNAVTAQVASATGFAVTVAANVYAPAVSGLSQAAVTTATSTALATFFGSYPVGGITGPTPGILSVEEIQDTIRNSVTAIIPSYAASVDVQMLTPTSDVTLGPGKVAVLTSSTVNLVPT